MLGSPWLLLTEPPDKVPDGVSNTRGDQSVEHSYLLRSLKIASPVLELAARDDNIIYQMLRLESRVFLFTADHHHNVILLKKLLSDLLATGS